MKYIVSEEPPRSFSESACPLSSASCNTSRSSMTSHSNNAPVSPQTVRFGGQGTGPQLVAQPTSLSFGHLLVGTKSPGLQVLLRNAGTAAATVFQDHRERR